LKPAGFASRIGKIKADIVWELYLATRHHCTQVQSHVTVTDVSQGDLEI